MAIGFIDEIDEKITTTAKIQKNTTEINAKYIGISKFCIFYSNNVQKTVFFCSVEIKVTLSNFFLKND